MIRCFLSAALAIAMSGVVFAQRSVPPDTVVATIDGKQLTAEQVRKMIATLPSSFYTLFKSNPANALQQYFVSRELSAEAEKLGLAEESPWKDQIENLKMYVLATAMVTREANVFRVPDEQAQKYYEANLPRFEQVTVKIIKIGFQPGMQPSGTSDKDLEAAARAALAGSHGAARAEADAKKLADSLVTQLRAGADFKTLAGQYSEDQESRDAGGDFGSISGSSPYPEALKQAALALKPGEVSEPVKVSVAFYIVRCETKKVQGYSDVHTQIVDELKQQHRDAFLKDLQKRFTPAAVNTDALSQIANGK